MKTTKPPIEFQGREGSPQPSVEKFHAKTPRPQEQNWHLPIQQNNPEYEQLPPSALPSPLSAFFPLPLRASAPPREFSTIPSRRSAAFTLLEVLIATAVLALMMAFLFNLLGTSAKLWEIGNKRIEAAQAARVGLNIIAMDLKNAFAGNMTTYNGTGVPRQNYACFVAFDAPSNTLNLSGASTVNSTHQLRAIVSTSDPTDPYNEIGLQCVHMNANHASGMAKNKCYLARKAVSSSSSQMFLASNNSTSPTASSWSFTTGNWSNFAPIIDNCIGLTFNYAYKNGTSISWTTSPNQTPSSNNFTTLPLGVLVTITVLDSKTAEKVAQLTDDDPIASSDTNVQRLISEGSVTMSRFIPFNSQ